MSARRAGLISAIGVRLVKLVVGGVGGVGELNSEDEFLRWELRDVKKTKFLDARGWNGFSARRERCCSGRGAADGCTPAKGLGAHENSWWLWKQSRYPYPRGYNWEYKVVDVAGFIKQNALNPDRT